MLRKNLLACALHLLILPAFAQDSTTTEEKTSPLSISGSADAYYRYDFAKTKANNYTSFTPTHNTFALGMASVKFDYTMGKVNAVLDLGFGPRAKDFAYTDDGITQAIKQAYISYAPADWISFSVGTWGTHVGYEVLDPQANRNYSTSYMFSNGPFGHTGVKANITKGKHGFMLGIANATDYRVVPDDAINRKFALAQYSLQANDNISLYVNYVGGKAPDTTISHQVDAVVTAKISDKFSIGYNGTVTGVNGWDGAKKTSSKTWWGSALYLNVDPKPWFGLTLRGEYFNDENGLKVYSGTDGGTIFATTLSANFKVGGLTFIPEFRVDNASKDYLFVKSDGTATKTAANFLFAAVYSF